MADLNDFPIEEVEEVDVEIVAAVAGVVVAVVEAVVEAVVVVVVEEVEEVEDPVPGGLATAWVDAGGLAADGACSGAAVGCSDAANCSVTLLAVSRFLPFSRNHLRTY